MDTLTGWLRLILASEVGDVEDQIMVSDMVHRMGLLPDEDIDSLSDDQVTELAAAVLDGGAKLLFKREFEAEFDRLMTVCGDYPEFTTAEIRAELARRADSAYD